MRVKADAIDGLYDKLETAEGQQEIYRIAAGRDRPGKDIICQILLGGTCIATDNACKLVINLIFNTIIYRIYIQYGYL